MNSTINFIIMQTDTTLDDLVLEYSENPFIDKKQYKEIFTSRQQKLNMLNRLLAKINMFISSSKERKEKFRS